MTSLKYRMELIQMTSLKYRMELMQMTSLKYGPAGMGLGLLLRKTHGFDSGGGIEYFEMASTLKKKDVCEKDEEEVERRARGLYYVYNSVTFKSNITQPRKTLFSYVHRVSPNSPSNSGVLLRSALSCENCLGISETSYTGGVFYLQEGDIIQVCISQQATFDNESTYVGLFLLKSF
ncbi:hypothetical protein Btru_074372 [Bulinus truncatus]|nr:hypothetical protein Btru_074372 [Bulinus truncatus]